MLLIISSEDDSCTNLVIDWLLRYQIEFIRINSEDKIEVLSIDLQNFEKSEIILRNKRMKISDFTAIWYRRSHLSLKKDENVKFSECIISKSINFQLDCEKKILEEFFLTELKKRSLNSQIDNDLNKLSVLKLCEKLKIKTPNTILTTQKKSLLAFKEKHGKVITKNFTPGMFIKNNEFRLGSGTILVTDEMIDELPNTFYPMLFQSLVDKAFELRVFYINGECYSSAIFSQNDERTRIDFRNYNFEKPNRTPPFLLPNDISVKLTLLMEKLDINSGSIDLIITTDGDVVFLEINPVGQFFQVSYPCSYYLEKKVAEFLINYQYGTRNC
jgi:ATP-GRASP peptide maturase of grasp-with-spasm system